MGLTSSTPRDPKGRECGHLLSITEKKTVAAATATAAGSPKEGTPKPTTGGDKGPVVKIVPRAKVLKNVSHELLWDNFLCSQANSFVISTSDTSALLAASLKPDILAAEASSAGGGGTDAAGKGSQADIDAYIELVKEVSHIKEGPVPIDFMSLCSSVLLLSDSPLEMKLDRLFEWITMGEKEYIEFNEMWMAMTSFERGLSNAMGEKESTEGFCKDTADKYVKLADPRKSGKIYQKDFFDFCMNRRFHVRRFLEALGSSTIKVPKVESVDNEVNVDNVMREPSGGDEFMANPAWKKTAEKMVPKGTIMIHQSLLLLTIQPSFPFSHS